MAVCLSLFAYACSSSTSSGADQSNGQNSGGTSSVGGQTSTGGSTSGAGQSATTSGGKAGSGGSSQQAPTGGSPSATGGQLTSGGSNTGGVGLATGGALGVGGNTTGGAPNATGGRAATGGATSTGVGGATNTGGKSTALGGASALGGTSATGGTVSATGGSSATGGTGTSDLPGDVAKAADTPFVAAHALTRALFAAYSGPLFRAIRISDNQEKDISPVSPGGLGDFATLNTFCSGTTCKVTTLYDQSGNGNDMWRADDPSKNQPGTVRPCDLMEIQFWQMSDGTKVPVVVETGALWKSTAQCLRNRDKTKNMPTGSKPQTEYAIFHAKYQNANCCFNYGNTGNAVHYTGPGTLSALNFSTITF